MEVREEVERLTVGRREVLAALRKIDGLRLHDVENRLQEFFEVLTEELDSVEPVGHPARSEAISDLMSHVPARRRRVPVAAFVRRLHAVREHLREAWLAVGALGVIEIDEVQDAALASVLDALDSIEG